MTIYKVYADKKLQGVPPATVAEWTLGGESPDGVDWYDGQPLHLFLVRGLQSLTNFSVSLVDGYNLPMR